MQRDTANIDRITSTAGNQLGMDTETNIAKATQWPHILRFGAFSREGLLVALELERCVSIFCGPSIIVPGHQLRPSKAGLLFGLRSTMRV